MRKLLCALAALICLPGAAMAQAPDFDEGADLVEALVVKARTPGPAWWKVSDADTTVWIMGDYSAASAVVWDEQTLQRRLKASRQLILPADGRVGVLSTASLVLGLRRYFFDPQPYRTRLPPELLRRFEVVAPLLDPSPPATANTMLLALDVQRLSRGGRRNAPVAASRSPEAAARAIASAAKVRVSAPPAIDTIAAMKLAVTIPEPARQDCLAAALDAYDRREAAPAATRRRAEAWARGDLPQALASGPSLSLGCAPPATLNAIFRRSQSQFVDLITQTMTRPGQVVGIASVVSLLSRDGIIEQLKAKGFAVVPPDSLED